MKKLIYLFAVLLLASCSDKIMDEIDTNPNEPEDVSIKLLLPQVTTNAGFTITANSMAWYTSVFIEQTCGVHGQLLEADQRINITSQTFNNDWNYMYLDQLMDLSQIIKKGSEGGTEEGNWKAVGIAKILYAHTFSIATDCFGQVPFSQALNPAEFPKPKFDNQQQIYTELQTLLDEAIADFGKTSVGTIGGVDLIYDGDAAKWVKAAWALKARLYNHLSKRDPQGSATAALDAVSKAFQSSAAEMKLDKFTEVATQQNPWFQEEADRGHHSLSKTIYDLLVAKNDPRLTRWFTKINGAFSPGKNGENQQDQAGTLYSKFTPELLSATTAVPIISFRELKFIEAEANFRKGDKEKAYEAYQAAVTVSLTDNGISAADRNTFMAQASVSPGKDGLTLELIMTQKYIAMFMFQSIEAWTDWRRTGFPAMQNIYGNVPRRLPYPDDELTTNAGNIPANITTAKGVWWDDGSED
jgi:hypothetical protein